MNDHYASDLAYIHHVGFDFYAKGAAPFIVDQLRSAGNGGRRVVDLGCGSGLLAKAFIRRGYDVVGIDQSAAMIKLARKQVPKAKFICGSFLDVALPEADAFTSTGECLNYLFDGRIKRATLRTLFRRIYDRLTPGGLFLFDTAEPGRGSGPRERHFDAKDWSLLLTVDENKKTNVLTRRIVTFRKSGTLYRKSTETHRLKLFRGADLVRDLRAIGFRARTVRQYGDFTLRPGIVGVMARKPE